MSHEHNDLTAANREAWDSKAKDYDAKPWQKKIASQVAEALTSHATWLGANWASSSSNNQCRLLDYACGTGSVTRALSNHITHATGIDISPNMLSQYMTLLSSSHPSLSLDTAIADFCSTSSSSPSDSAISAPEFFNYDIAGVALGFHHFSTPTRCIEKLAQRLKSNGVLFIIDWLPKQVNPAEHIGRSNLHPEESHQCKEEEEKEKQKETETEEWKKMKKTIKTNGFTEQDMRGFFEQAGFEEFGFVVLEKRFLLEMNGKEVEKTGFIAKGRKV